MSPSAIPTTPIFNPVNVQSLVTVKLTKDNYLLWRAQVTPSLRGQQLFGHVDGTIIAPPKFITTSAPSSTTPVQIENLAYNQWFQKDQVILSILMSSLSEGILSQVINHQLHHLSRGLVWIRENVLIHIHCMNDAFALSTVFHHKRQLLYHGVFSKGQDTC